MLNNKIAIDLGTCNSLVYVQGRGVVLYEPSVVAISLADKRILAVGEEAKEMIGRTPADIKVYRPLKDGVIADYKVTQAMMKYFIAKSSSGFKPFKPELVISVPAGITSTEKRAVIEAALTAGAKSAYVAKEPILAAIGAGIPINSCSGHMIINIGGGTTEVAVISLGGIVTATSARVAGDKIDMAIAEYIKKKYNLAVGTQSAEEIKIKVGTALPQKELKFLEIQGRDLILGLPRNIKISNNDVCEAISDTLGEIMQAVKHVLSETPPELSADIMNKGIIMSGGGSLLPKINELVAQSTGVPCFVAEEPLFCVVKGTGTVLEHLDDYKKVVMTKK
ncbi:MAG TPA: rod shape-determining protein [Candidatus Staskawiczbacteria bacterium]|nr:rod shape-determining protein [Candidatus Staskawiczbacteria bacterium]